MQALLHMMQTAVQRPLTLTAAGGWTGTGRSQDLLRESITHGGGGDSPSPSATNHDSVPRWEPQTPVKGEAAQLPGFREGGAGR